MKQTKFYQAYLVDMHKVDIYIALDNYGGLSQSFYLQRDDHYQIPLRIVDDIIVDGYHKYECVLSEMLVFGKQYDVYHQFGRYTPLVFSGVVKTKMFDDMFCYEADDLGSHYTKEKTTFKLWAPTAYQVYLKLTHNNDTQMIAMQRTDKGVYEYTAHGDVENATYLYQVAVNGEVNTCLDPYAKASTANSQQSVVVNLAGLKQKTYPLAKLDSYCDAIIYEASIRDYTHDGNIMSFIHDEQQGLDYISTLGITHLQLLPMLDFKSVDDLDVKKYYNWGYDAYQWMAFENSYASDPSNPIQIMKEVKMLIDACHQKGMRVNFDVVFNHVYEINDCSLQMSVPYYYFQYANDKGYSNATMCGNDVDSTRKMCRKIIVDSCVYLAQEFQIDGLRFDLMGILDVDTLNEVVAKTKAINPSFMIYGEGWHMPSYLEDSQRASIPNNAKMLEVAHFSDRFRDVVKGSTSVDQVRDLGYMLSNVGKCYQTMNVLGGSTQDVGDTRLFVNADQSVNYVECHDNMTSWDKVDAALDLREDAKKQHHKMLIASVLLAQGIPFLHGGQEFARTKQGLPNTYNAPDTINKIDYVRMRYHQDIVEYTKQLIQVRKSYSCLRQSKAEDIHENVAYEMVNHTILKYCLQDNESDLIILFNPTYTMYTYDIEEGYELVFYNALLKAAEVTETIQIHGISVVILSKRKP